MPYAPIALFVYKRLSHTKQTIASLLKNSLAKESDLFIYSDGPKDDEASEHVMQVRQWIEQITGFKKIYIIKHEKNLGLARSIISGVTELVSKYGKVIVVEDDLLVSPYFLKFMNDGLDVYQDVEKVASIHGYSFALDDMPTTYFLKGADCWGWATWRRAWDIFEPDGNLLLNLLKQSKLEKSFNFENTQPNIQMLKDQINGKNNSWAIRWNASAFVKNMLTLYPGKSLVCNIGLDNSGEHCAQTNMYDVNIHQEPIQVGNIPIEPNIKAYEAYVRFYQQLRVPFLKKVLRKAKSLIVSQ